MSFALVLLLILAGNFVVSRSARLKSLNIPGAFVAGIIGSLVHLGLDRSGLFTFSISESIRDLLLVIVYACAGLSTSSASWGRAGRPLILFSTLCALLILLQNLLGLALASSTLALPAAYGILCGSVAFTGGLGSAVAWGDAFGGAGVDRATEVSVIAATLGLLLGSLIGGPYVSWVLRRQIPAPDQTPSAARPPEKRAPWRPQLRQLLCVFALVGITVLLGDLALRGFTALGVVTPRFLTSMLAGLALSAVLERWNVPVDRQSLERGGEICLTLFIVIALTGIRLWELAGVALPVALLTAAQFTGTLLFAHFAVLRFMGRDYEAAVIAGGTIGFGLSSFAAAIAIVKETERRYGAAPRALLLVTLVGGAIANLLNAVIIAGFFQWLRE